MALTLVVGILLARQLGPSGYGVYSLAMAVVTLVGMLTEFGLPVLAMREFAAAEARQSWGEARGMMRWADHVILGISSVLLGAFFAAALLFNFFARSAFLATMVWAMLLVPTVGLGKLRALALLSLGHTFASQFAVLVLRPGLFAIALAILWSLPGQLGPAGAMAWQAVAAAAALLTVATFFRRHRPASFRNSAPVTRKKQWLIAAIPMGMTEGLRLLQGQMATLLLGVLATTSAVGQFRVANAAAAICLVPITLLNVVASPYFAKLHAEGSKTELQQIVTAVSVATFLCVAMITLPMFLFARPLLAWSFGTKFAPSASAFQTILAGNLIASALGPSVTLANMTGQEKMVTFGTAIAVVTVTICLLLMVPALGYTGAAIAVAVAIVVWVGTLTLIVRVRLGVDPTIFSLDRKGAASVARVVRATLRGRQGAAG